MYRHLFEYLSFCHYPVCVCSRSASEVWVLNKETGSLEFDLFSGVTDCSVSFSLWLLTARECGPNDVIPRL